VSTSVPRRWRTVDAVLAIVGGIILLGGFLLVVGASAWEASRDLARYGGLGLVGAGAVVVIFAWEFRRVAAMVGRGVLDNAEGREARDSDEAEGHG